jgi:ribosomal protein L30/L7E
MIIALRIAGQVKQKKKDEETMKRLNLHKKYSAVLIEEQDRVKVGMIEAVQHCITYGPINEELIKKLEERKKEKNYTLHPPRGGLKKSSKLQTPKGILGYNKEITKLIERML